MAHACNAITWETGVGELSQVGGHSLVHSEFLDLGCPSKQNKVKHL